ncbi:MAG: DUF6446 family protein [Pseudomonadota bacterium]
MSGKLVVSVLLTAMLLFGAGLYYTQVYAYYEEVSGIETILVQGREVAVREYLGIDADTSPNKLRGCFQTDPAAFVGLPLARDPDPLVAPGWFGCFQAETLAQDIAAGLATAYLVGDETPSGAAGYEIHRMVAIYPDGRGYLWRHYREN